MSSAIRSLLRKAFLRISANRKPPDGARYWQDRARKYGKRAVLNLAHPESKFDQVTDQQKKILFPVLSSLLNGSEKTVLDFGCGPGRFTRDLANAIHGHAVGLDISSELISMAPTADNVTYRAIPDGVIPAFESGYDVIWVCLVLGGISAATLKSAADALDRVLSPGGLLFLVENTSAKPDGSYWYFRSVAQYQALFPSIDLRLVTSYSDVGEEISVLAGRKRPC